MTVAPKKIVQGGPFFLYAPWLFVLLSVEGVPATCDVHMAATLAFDADEGLLCKHIELYSKNLCLCICSAPEVMARGGVCWGAGDLLWARVWMWAGAGLGPGLDISNTHKAHSLRVTSC